MNEDEKQPARPQWETVTVPASEKPSAMPGMRVVLKPREVEVTTLEGAASVAQEKKPQSDLDHVLSKHVEPFRTVHHWHDPAVGIIAWRAGIHGNTEICAFAPAGPSKDNGRALLFRMLDDLEVLSPWQTVYAVAPVGIGGEGWLSKHFWLAMGFSVQEVHGLCGEGGHLLWQTIGELIRHRQVWEEVNLPKGKR